MPDTIDWQGEISLDKKKSLLQQIIRFGFVGGGAFIIDYGIMIFLTEIAGMNYLVSSAISFLVSVIFNYILSIKWVFNVLCEKSQAQELTVFMILSLIGLGINQLIMWLTVDKLHIFYMLAKIGATAVVMVYNFVTRKLFLENRRV
ncbi:MAG: GtrA family protein [Dorea sp.]|nr:GtrA family protein [Dorea sp.]